MIPDIELQMQVVVKSIKDNVLPAIDSSNELALQQAGLSVATLENILTHFTKLHRALRKDITIHCNLAIKILATASPKSGIEKLDAVLKMAEKQLDDPTNGISDLQKIARDLREEIGVVIRENHQLEIAKTILSTVLEHSDSSLKLGRAYNKLMGFEPDSELVPDLKDIV